MDPKVKVKDKDKDKVGPVYRIMHYAMKAYRGVG
jgi:hypothetical protein